MPARPSPLVRIAIVAGYTLGFWLLLPALLWALGAWVDARLGVRWDGPWRAVGALPAGIGAAWLLRGIGTAAAGCRSARCHPRSS